MQPRPNVKWGFRIAALEVRKKHSLLFNYVNHGKEAPIGGELEPTLNQHVDACMKRVGRMSSK